jgi:SAM-dependent methyltransferase
MAAPEWNERYRRGEHAHDPPLSFVVEMLDRLGAGEGRRALDLACGSGRHSIEMASRGWSVTAVDWSDAALEMLRSRDARVETVEADLEAGHFEIGRNAWDLICVCLYLQRNLFAAIRGGIKGGGWILVAFPLFDERPDVRPMNPGYTLRAGELRSLFEGFEVLHYCEAEPPPPNRRMAYLLARKPDKIRQ